MFDQLTKDVEYCIQQLGCDFEQTDELISAATTVGVNAEYFCEEFIVAPDDADCMKYQDDDYLNLEAFNALHGIYFEEVE